VTTLEKLAATAATSLLVAALAGCGGDDSGSGDPAPTATVTVTATGSATPTATPTVGPTVGPTDDPTAEPTPTVTSPVPATAPPTTYAEALARIGAARDVTEQGAAQLAAFTSPSGNIYCALNQPSAYPACELRTGQVEDPSACGDQPMTTQVGRLELHPEGAVPVCNTDTIVQPGAAVLAYGTAAFTRDTACVSEQVGVTCVSRAAPAGFFLAKGRYTLLQ
jgi:hypothetical protein